MENKLDKKSVWLAISPWAILGSLIVLVPMAVFIAASSYTRDRENMMHLLTEKGAALIRALEAGTRTGMAHMGWGEQELQRLLAEMARHSDILYVAVTDDRGTVLAHSDPEQINTKINATFLPAPMPGPTQPLERFAALPDGTRSFEVYRQFKPAFRGMHRPGHMHRRGMMEPWWWLFWERDNREVPQANEEYQAEPVRYIFVGLDTEPLASSRREAIRHAVFLGAVLVLVGIGGLVSIFFAQGYKIAQRSLARVKLFSDQVVERMPLGLVASDGKGNVAVYNGTAEAILGQNVADVMDRPASEVIPKEIWNLATHIDRTGMVMEEEVEYHGNRLNTVPLSVSGAAIREGESFHGYVFLFRDMTEIRRLQQEVERSRRLASVGDLAAGVAHEIRNPLSSIKGFATYFMERYKEYPQDRETAKVMIGEVERLDRVVGQLLEFARPSRLKVIRTAVEEMIPRSIKLIEGDAKKKNVMIHQEIAQDLPRLDLDVDRFNQALLNLYLNALQVLEDGGSITVKVFEDEIRGQMKIQVSDNGCGISPENRERIFDPYYTTKAWGTGLGLAIVHKIVEAHGGSIFVASTEGIGTTMTISLPVPQGEKYDDTPGQTKPNSRSR